MRDVRVAFVTALLMLAARSTALGQAPASARNAETGASIDLDAPTSAPPAPITVAVDADDDDDDGVADREQTQRVPLEDVAVLSIAGARPITVTVSDGLRVFIDGAARDAPATLTARDQRLGLQAVRATQASWVELAAANGARVRIPVTTVGIAFLDSQNRRSRPAIDAVGLSHFVTNDTSLPTALTFDTTADDPDAIRLEIFDPSRDAAVSTLDVGLAAIDPIGRFDRDARTAIRVRRGPDRAVYRSDFLRLVGDQMDRAAPGAGDRVLRVALRDKVRIRYSGVSQDIRVGRPGDEDGPRAARRARFRIRVVRVSPGGAVPLGGSEAGALAIARRQVEIANEVWLQCFVTFGPPESADVAVVDPPPPALLAFADRDGLPASGSGFVRLRVNGRLIGPVQTHPDARPVETALDVAAALRAAGFSTRVTENAPTEFGAGRSADLVVRDARGALARLAADGAAPLSTDSRQTVTIGSVDLSDGIEEFDNMTASAGTLEERTLLKTLGDDTPETIDIFIVNRFAQGTRQGEAFIEGDGGSVWNSLILDRTGVRQEREAWTQAHEAGHVLLDHPFHPDNIGPDRPWLLMDADNSLGMVTGPKRLEWNECHRLNQMSGLDAVPSLLSREDVRTPTPSAAPASTDDLGW